MAETVGIYVKVDSDHDAQAIINWGSDKLGNPRGQRSIKLNLDGQHLVVQFHNARRDPYELG